MTGLEAGSGKRRQNDDQDNGTMLRILILLIVLPLVLIWPEFAGLRNGAEAMAENPATVEAIRMQYEAQIMAVEGVVAVSEGIGKYGAPCLTIYTSAAPEDVRGKLPEAIFQVCIEIDNVGEIKAQ